MSKNSVISKKAYNKEMERLQVELIKLQRWIKENDKKVVVIFEGRDAAGKGGTIKRITQKLNTRLCKVAALPVPTEREKTQWYFQRFAAYLPAVGEMVLFDRSWYNRAGVEKIMGFCTDEEYRQFLLDCPKFENLLISSGIILIKYWFSVSREEQLERLHDRNDDITKRWKLGSIDLASINKWDEYSKARDAMLEKTDTGTSPWYIIKADVKKHARINCITHLLSQFDYHDTECPEKDMPKAGEKTYADNFDKSRYVEDAVVKLIKKSH